MANQQKVNLGRLLYKRLCHEMKSTVTPKEKFADTPAFQYIANQFRENQVTSQKLCKGQNEMMMVGQTYLCMLESLRKSEELSQMYKTTERSIEDSANLVGLKLPTKDS
ncbi:protein FMC1 homolog [Crassostrea virginica]|uniref:Protein FMC1 homolog n=1 Tax=Crassostrea virginica TaxID=6565 RepID=A0A8B8BKY9_CRAVI|nr:protein FMC1 homolog [Crassostrea virginica]